MPTLQSQIETLAARTKDAASFWRYASWRAVAAMLLRRGYTSRAAEAILRSKIARWAVDESRTQSGRASGRDLARYIDRHPEQVADLMAEEGLVTAPAQPRKSFTDAEFDAWCLSNKPCRYCSQLFWGPVCQCENRDRSRERSISQITLALPNKRSG